MPTDVRVSFGLHKFRCKRYSIHLLDQLSLSTPPTCLHLQKKTSSANMKFIETMNERVDNSFIGKYFQIKERASSFSTELAGATATFLTMAYILAVNPRILADSGGPCVADPDDPAGECISSYSYPRYVQALF